MPGTLLGSGSVSVPRAFLILCYIEAIQGFLPLANAPILRLLGGDQFRKFCVVAMAVLVITVWITCWCHEEKERRNVYKKQSTAASVMENIYNAIVKLPKPIRRVCAVQIFAFMGWQVNRLSEDIFAYVFLKVPLLILCV